MRVSDRHQDPSIALIIIDMINDLEFEDGEKLHEHMSPAATKIAKLRTDVKKYHIPVIYVNDNYGRWQSDFRQLVEHCIDNDVRGQKIAKLLHPEEEDYFVLKPQFSAFFHTPFDLLLRYLDVRTLILTGVAGNMCIHFTANDAYMRGYGLVVPRDCTASNEKKDNDEALNVIEKVLGASTTPSTNLNLRHLITEAQAHYEATN